MKKSAIDRRQESKLLIDKKISSCTSLKLITSLPKSHLIGSVIIHQPVTTEGTPNVLSLEGVVLTECVHDSSESASTVRYHGAAFGTSQSKDLDGDSLTGAVGACLVGYRTIVCISG
jgi:hypothetical protein